MKTITTFHSARTTIAVEGRLDSREAPLLQEAISEAIGTYGSQMTELVIDTTHMDFISSMGLRIFLQLRSKDFALRIVGCQPDVYKVFQVTGFDKIFSIERALEQITLDGLEQIPGIPDFYALTDETMLRVYPTATTREDIERELALTQEVMLLGLPTCINFDIVGVGSNLGLVYERLSAKQMDAKEMARVLLSLHACIIEPDGIIPDFAANVKLQIEALRPHLGDEAVAKLLRMLSTVPGGSSLLHGNISANSILCRDDAPIMIYMNDVGYGNPVLELAYLYSTLPQTLRTDFFDTLLNTYFAEESFEKIESLRQNIVTLSIIRDLTGHLLSGEPSSQEVKLMQDTYQERVADRWDEILSHLHFKMDFAEEIRTLERQRFYLKDNVDIDWVARRLGTNRHYVSDYFNKVLHLSFSDYINNKRLDYALRLMHEGRIKPAQIPYEAGFNNDHTFRRLFKQRFGVTPSKYDLAER